MTDFSQFPDIIAAAAAVAATAAAHFAAKRFSAKKIFGFKMSAVPSIIPAGMVIAAAIALMGVDLKNYEKGGDLIVAVLAPATLALALPLYKFRGLIKDNLPEIAAATAISSVASIGSIYVLAKLAGLGDDIFYAVSSKCVTAPAAIEITKMAGSKLFELTMCGVFVSGLLGASIGHGLMALLRVKSDVSKGLAMGATSHVVGTARCLDFSPKQAAFSALILVMTAVFTTILAAVVF